MTTALLNISYTLDNVEQILQKFWNTVRDYPIIAFSGQMGAGKTTFIHKLCDFLQVEDAVSSPTFALINEYHFNADQVDNTIYHMDWYRLKGTEEAISAGMEDCLTQAKYGNTFCFVEWPEKALDILPFPHIWIDIDSISETERSMRVKLISNTEQ